MLRADGSGHELTGGRFPVTRPTAVWIFNHHAAGRDQGTGTRHLDLGARLAAQGVAVTIFAAGFNHFTGREERLRRWQLTTSENVDGVRFVWLRTLPYRGNGLGRILNMASYFVMAIVVQAARHRPTHVVGSTVHPLAALAAWLVARSRRAPFYFEIRDLWPQTLIDIGVLRAGSLPARTLSRLERFLVERSRAVITVLPGAASYFEERGLRPRALAYIPNGVDLGRPDEPTHPNEAGRPEPEALRRIAQHRAAGHFVATYTGAHATHNRLEVVLEAAVQLRAAGHDEIRIVLVGDGPDKPALEQQRVELGLTNLDLLPPVPKAQVAAVLHASDACLLHMTRTPVYRYGVSFNKLFDYLASRRPIVFACESSYDPVARAASGITVPPDDPGAICEALVTLASTPAAEREAMAERGYQFVHDHHNIDKLAAQLFEVLSA